MGGFGHVRVSMAIVYEIIRQNKHNLTMAGKTASAATARALLPAHLHLAPRPPPGGPRPARTDLQSTLPRCRRRRAEVGPRPALCWRASRPGGGAAYLGAPTRVPSACALPGARRGAG